MHNKLNGKNYVQRIQNVAYLCLGIPLLFFIYLYLESSVDQLEAKIPVEYQMTLFVPLLLFSLGIIIWGFRDYNSKIELARQSESFSEKLNIYRKTSHRRFLIYGISSTLITIGFYLTNFQAFAALFGIMIVLFSINNPNARKIAEELRLKEKEKDIIIKGLDFANKSIVKMKHIVILALAFIASACPGDNKKSLVRKAASKSIDLTAEADKLAHEFIITDGHVDLPYRLKSKMEDVAVETIGGHFDYVRAKRGGLDAPFMSIYIPAAKEMNGAMTLALELIASVEKLTVDHPDKFALATTPTEIEKNFEKGLISFPMGLENGAPVEGNLGNIDLLFEKGIRYITLTHSKDNHISDSSYDQKYTHGGLSPFGYLVIERMNELGIMVDVSHVSDSAYYQAVKYSKAPVIASHSSCRYFTPGFERNVSDDMIRLVADHDGIIMINFGSAFITKQGMDMRNIKNRFREELEGNETLLQAKLDSLQNEPKLMGDVSAVADHIDHVVKIGGIDHVGFGSDFDGVNNLPIGLKDASKYPDLIHELLKRGYTAENIEKICCKNLFRVWNEVITVAEEKSPV